MLKLNAVELNKVAETVKRVLICSHSTQAGEIARRVWEKFAAQEKVDNEKEKIHDVNRQHKPPSMDSE